MYHWPGNCWWWRFPCPCSHTHIYIFMYILILMSNNLVNQSTKAISTNELRWIEPVLAVVSSGPMDLFLLLILQLLLIWCCGYWKILILLHYTLELPSLFVHHLDTCHELVCILLFCHYLTPVCYGFCISNWSNSLSNTLNSSCHRLDIFLAHVYFDSICNFCMFLFCISNCSFDPAFLWHQILYYHLLPLLMLSGPLFLDSSGLGQHLLTGDFIYHFGCK